MNATTEKLRSLYEKAEQVRSTFANASKARPAYERYVEFIRCHTVAKDEVLDVGCGTGWSAYFFAEAGFQTTGVDLNVDAFEAPHLPNLTLTHGSALDLPFPDASFDAVAAHQVLEHLAEPRRMLLEMLRVLRPGGVLGIVGPNLVSIGNCLRVLGWSAWKNRPFSRIFFRAVGMPRHPFGNTVPEACASLVVTLGRILRKHCQSEPGFLLREPDLVPPFHGDNDAVYVCNPLDVARFLKRHRCTVLRDVALGRSTWTRMLAGGTWIAARKN